MVAVKYSKSNCSMNKKELIKIIAESKMKKGTQLVIESKEVSQFLAVSQRK
jgi:hypothetical protein